MPTAAGDIVDEARDYSMAFDPKTIPEKMALRQLSRLQTRLAEEVTAISEEALAVTVSFPKVDVDAAALAGVKGLGLTLPDHLILLAAYTSRTTGIGAIPVDLVSYANNQAEALRVFPSVYILRQRLYPVNTYEAGGFIIKGDGGIYTHGWENLNGLDVLLVPTPAKLLVSSDPISLPDSTHNALTTSLALWMAGRTNVLSTLPGLSDEAQRAHGAAVSTLANQDTTSNWTVLRK